MCLVRAVEKRDNFDEIRECALVCNQDSIDISVVFDCCCDEVAVDAVVAMGGNPSVTGGIFEEIPGDQACLNVRRRLYHGASGLYEQDLVQAKDFVDFYFRPMRWRVTPPARRPCYIKANKEKFQFWLKYKPSVYSTESTQDVPVPGGNGGWEFGRMYDGDGVQIYPRPSMKVVRGSNTSNTLQTVYTKKHLTVAEWEDAERAFGEYHRKSNILISCQRASKKKRRPTKPKKACQQLKFFMHSLPIGVAKLILSFV